MKLLTKVQSTLDILVEAATGGAAATAVKRENPNFIVSSYILVDL